MVKHSNLNVSQAYWSSGYYAVNAAISFEDGLELIHIHRSAIKTETFIDFIEELRKINQGKKLTLFMDRASYHLSKGTKAALAAHLDAFGEAAEVGFWVFSTNAVATAGMLGIPTIGFGPGHEKFAHAPNEQVEIEHLVRCSAFYTALVDEFAKG